MTNEEWKAVLKAQRELDEAELHSEIGACADTIKAIMEYEFSPSQAIEILKIMALQKIAGALSDEVVDQTIVHALDNINITLGSIY